MGAGVGGALAAGDARDGFAAAADEARALDRAPRTAPRMIRTLAPASSSRGDGALDATGAAVARLGARPLLVHGEVGFALVADRLRTSLAAADRTARETAHAGPVTAAAIERLAQSTRRPAGTTSWSASAAAACSTRPRGRPTAWARPFVAIPTSPATCAATTALSVLYDDAWVWQAPAPTRACPTLVVLDPVVLAAAPDRLLAAGVLDALCKVEEVRIASRTAPPATPGSDAALAVCDALAAWVDPATGALTDGLPSAPDVRAALAEAVVVLPGLIAGLGGRAATSWRRPTPCTTP